MLDKQVALMSTMVVLDIRFKKFPASQVASSILYYARKHIGIVPYWRSELSSMTGYDASDLIGVLELVDLAYLEIKAKMGLMEATITPVKTASVAATKDKGQFDVSPTSVAEEYLEERIRRTPDHYSDLKFFR